MRRQDRELRQIRAELQIMNAQLAVLVQSQSETVRDIATDIKEQTVKLREALFKEDDDGE